MKKTKFLFASALLMILASAMIISAFGVSSPYWETNPLTLGKGETAVVNLNLQNMVGDEDVKVAAKLIDGTDIASIKETTYTVKAGTSDTMVPLTISIPEEMTLGESKQVKVEFKTVSDNNEGIAMGTGMTVSFDVIAGQVIPGSNVTIILISVGIIVLAVILWLIFRNRKKRK